MVLCVVMTLTLELPPAVEAQLRRRAAAEGKDVPALVLEAVTEKLAAEIDPSSLTPDERLAGLRAWVDLARKHSAHLPPGHVLDDDRESIYREREDAQL